MALKDKVDMEVDDLDLDGDGDQEVDTFCISPSETSKKALQLPAGRRGVVCGGLCCQQVVQLNNGKNKQSPRLTAFSLHQDNSFLGRELLSLPKSILPPWQFC